MSTPPAALPEDAILVHIGPHKTGTSAIQSTLADSRGELQAHGVQYVGRRIAHHVEAKALRQISDGWKHDADAIPDPSVWSRFAAQVTQIEGRVVVSSEFFAQADAAARATLIRDLGPERVYVLAAARQPAAMAVSVWQQVLRAGNPITLEEWLEKNFRRSAPNPQATGFWSFADAAVLARAWSESVGLDRLCLVILDESDRRRLPATFERMLDLPDGTLADRSPSQPNRGLSAVEAALLHQVIEKLDSKLTWAEFTQLIRKGVTKRLLEIRRPGPDEAKAALPTWAVEQAIAEGAQITEGLRGIGVRMVGDLEALRVVQRDSTETGVISQIPVDLAAEAVVGAIAVATRSSWTLDAPRPKPTPTRARPATAPPPGAAKSTSPPVDTVRTRELAAILRQRVRAGLRRRAKRLLRRTPK